MARTLTPPAGQASLFDLEPEPAPAPQPEPEPEPLPIKQQQVRPRVHPPRPRRDPDRIKEPCDPRCIVCGHPEGRGLCTPRCAVLCQHTTEPGRAELCLVTTRVTARLVVGIPGAEPGRRLAVVDSCPFCERTHWHTPAYGLHYRLAGCGKAPYLVQLDRPRIAPAQPTPGHTDAAARGAGLARQLLTSTEAQ